MMVTTENPMEVVGMHGHIRFVPRLQLTDEQTDHLRKFFLDHTGCEDAENGTILLDWRINEVSGPPYRVRELVTMWRDGGDSEKPWVIFYRTGDPARPGSVHVPPAETSMRFAADDAWWYLSWAKMAQVDAEVSAYLAGVLNDPEAWVDFDIDADPFADESGNPIDWRDL